MWITDTITDELIQLFRERDGKLIEDNVLFTVTEDGKIVVNAMSELNINTEPYTIRVLLYHKGCGWELSEENYSLIGSEGLIRVICKEHEVHSGDIYFGYEQGEDEDYDYYGSACEFMLDTMLDTERVYIIYCDNATFNQMYTSLAKGNYLVMFR